MMTSSWHQSCWCWGNGTINWASTQWPCKPILPSPPCDHQDLKIKPWKTLPPGLIQWKAGVMSRVNLVLHHLVMVMVLNYFNPSTPLILMCHEDLHGIIHVITEVQGSSNRKLARSRWSQEVLLNLVDLEVGRRVHINLVKDGTDPNIDHDTNLYMVPLSNLFKLSFHLLRGFIRCGGLAAGVNPQCLNMYVVMHMANHMPGIHQSRRNLPAWSRYFPEQNWWRSQHFLHMHFIWDQNYLTKQHSAGEVWSRCFSRPSPLAPWQGFEMWDVYSQVFSTCKLDLNRVC